MRSDPLYGPVWSSGEELDAVDLNGKFGYYVPMVGGQMRGPLLLTSGSPTDPMEAVPKYYVDRLVPFDESKFLQLSGGTMTGVLTLSGDPVGVLDAAPKRYVDSKFGNFLPLTGGTVTGATRFSGPGVGVQVDNTLGASSVNTGSLTVTGLLSGSGVTNLLAPYAPLQSPGFLGTPTAPTASPGNASTQLATTKFVTDAIVASSSGVVSFNGRTGAVTLQSNDITGALGYTPYNVTNPAGYQTAAQVNAVFASPPALGSATPAPATISDLSVLNTVGGPGFASLFTAPAPIGSVTPNTGAFTALSASGVVSGVGFTNLFASPPPIGNTTANSGAFTTLSANGAVSGAGFTSRFSAPGPIGNTTPSTGAFTTLSASSTVSGAGINALFASPPVGIGSTAPVTGSFTSVSTSSAVNAGGTPNGLVSMQPGTSTVSGYIGFFNAAGSTLYAYLGQAPFAGGLLPFVCQNGITGVSLIGSLAISTTLGVTGATTLAGVTATALTVGIGAIGRVGLVAGNASNAGYLAFYNTTGTRVGYIGFGPTAGGLINMVANEGGMTGFQISGTLGVSSNLTVSGPLNVSGATGFAAGVTSTNGRIMSQSGGQSSVSVWNTAVGAAGMWFSNAGFCVLGQVDGNGVPVAAWISANAGNMFACNTGDFGFEVSGPSRIQCYTGAYYWQYGTTSGDLIWVRNGTTFWTFRVSDSLCFNNIGVVGGNGAYYNYSDARGKEEIEPSPYGLAEVMRLRPVRFRRIKNDDTEAPLELGFVAQEVQEVLPEVVAAHGIGDTDGTHSVDSEDPYLAIAELSMIGALVSAVQELSNRVQTLEGRAL
jgi:hypothetical protein